MPARRQHDLLVVRRGAGGADAVAVAADPHEIVLTAASRPEDERPIVGCREGATGDGIGNRDGAPLQFQLRGVEPLGHQAALSAEEQVPGATYDVAVNVREICFTLPPSSEAT